MAIIASQYVTGRKVEIRIHPILYKESNIFSAYSLCSHLPFEELTAALASAYAVTVLVVELVASPGETGIGLCTLASSTLTPAPASSYSLSTAVT